MTYNLTDLLLVSYYTILNGIYYCTLYVILCLPNFILKCVSADYMCILCASSTPEDESDESDTEVVPNQKQENGKKQEIIEVMQKNNIRSNQFSEDFIGEYTDLFFSIHLKHHKEYKLIQFIRVEILDEYGLILDMTYRISFFVKDNYIHLQKIKQYYPDSEFMFILYKDVYNRKIHRKMIHLPSKKELLENKKCSFGKVLL